MAEAAEKEVGGCEVRSGQLRLIDNNNEHNDDASTYLYK